MWLLYRTRSFLSSTTPIGWYRATGRQLALQAALCVRPAHAPKMSLCYSLCLPLHAPAGVSGALVPAAAGVWHGLLPRTRRVQQARVHYTASLATSVLRFVAAALMQRAGAVLISCHQARQPAAHRCTVPQQHLSLSSVVNTHPPHAHTPGTSSPPTCCCTRRVPPPSSRCSRWQTSGCASKSTNESAPHSRVGSPFYMAPGG